MTTNTPGDAVPASSTAPEAAQVLPLTGITVLDIGHVLAGPFASYQLALLGAEVIRVEPVDSTDFVRRHGGTAEMKAAGLGASFLSQNAGKRSAAINLKDPRGIELVGRLAARSDVMLQNFRPGVAARLGIGFDAIAELNPRIIYLSLSGYGESGPLAHAPAYDHILQGLSGMMAMTGTPDSGPMRVGFPIVDYIAGQTAAGAVLAALLQRDRNGAGAQHLTVSMLDSIVSLMAAYAVDHQTTGQSRGLEGNKAFSGSPFSDRFETADGQLVVTANTADQALRLCNATGKSDLTIHVRRELAGETLTEEDRARIGAGLKAAFLERPAAEWEVLLNRAGVPSAHVRSLAQVLEHPQLTHNRLMRELAVPELGLSVSVPHLPFSSSGWRRGPLAPAPTLGRDTSAVLSELALGESEIDALRAEGVIG
ncbi:crotonobetainyl-CoA:carnitine CoA-transferase CaiB-like acyl-CoA transferase [Hoeflea marina]|uniref:Crotonobetainyl-CoA:carnitine CoA-transferase CaiB-like acyl-CoA transferase n=1 Tax=Hoeflea marina TaxID=274592 RepID=A0A317PGR4_9HYPH|nr:CoA transferase [Hoeflea marina]PWV99225.1 crotonobetainyl-CoA:carnitine CoA-transferase CaiB-like acyl-CoA transferase [Hoeflea marina]